MDSKETPFAPISEVPLHRNAPLAPTQELAYRKKCIALKRRLAEIESNNDTTRKKIAQEARRVQKMRLNRAIILNKLQDIMATPARKLTSEEVDKLGLIALAANGNRSGLAEFAGSSVVPELLQSRPEAEVLLDDSSDETDEDEPEPSERPERRRRTNNTFRETVLNTTAPADTASNMYQQSTLPNLAPASSFSPAAPHDATMLTSSFRVNSSTPQTGSRMAQQYPDAAYSQSSPMTGAQQPGMPYPSPSEPRPPSIPDVNGIARGVPQRPDRPEDPYTQFTLHMRPQLEADYPPGDIPAKIQYEWDNLSHDNRKLWEDRYLGQMQEYETAMDAWKKARRDGPGGFVPGNS